MHALGTLLTGFLLVGFLPGFVELGEDMLHLAIEGHTLHTTDHDGEDEQPSHGCDDCTHCVSCHGQGTAFLVAVTAPVPGAMTVADSGDRWHVAGVALDGVRARLDRPPQA
ncbi:MAG: hypothetical protein RLO52_26290 [Sandaracinaceae bacterium]